jgi:hypothetical protein
MVDACDNTRRCRDRLLTCRLIGHRSQSRRTSENARGFGSITPSWSSSRYFSLAVSPFLGLVGIVVGYQPWLARDAVDANVCFLDYLCKYGMNRAGVGNTYTTICGKLFAGFTSTPLDTTRVSMQNTQFCCAAFVVLLVLSSSNNQPPLAFPHNISGDRIAAASCAPCVG